MGRRGPQPKPTELKILEGNPGHRPLPAGEPQPRIGAPPCPRWLDPDAKAEWRLIVGEWARSAPRLLTRVDGGVLAGYCQSRARWKQAELEITADLDQGLGLDRTKVLTATKYLEKIRAFAQELGLTPAARTRLSLPAAGEPDLGILS